MGNSRHIGYFCQILSFLILDQDPVWQVLFHLSYEKPGWCGSQDKDYSAKNQPSIMSRTFFSGQLTSVLGLNTKLGTTSKKETEQNIVNFFCVTKKNLRGANAGCLRPFTTRARVRTRLWSLGGVQKSSASEGFIGRKNFWQSETKASARAPEVVRPPKATRVRENSIRPSVSCPRGFVGMRPVCRHRLCRDARAFSKNP